MEQISLLHTPINQARTASCFTISFLHPKTSRNNVPFLNGCFAITNHTNNELTCYFFAPDFSFLQSLLHILSTPFASSRVSDSVCQFSIKHIICIDTGKIMHQLPDIQIPSICSIHIQDVGTVIKNSSLSYRHVLSWQFHVLFLPPGLNGLRNIFSVPTLSCMDGKGMPGALYI